MAWLEVSEQGPHDMMPPMEALLAFLAVSRVDRLCDSVFVATADPDRRCDRPFHFSSAPSPFSNNARRPVNAINTAASDNLT